MEVVIPVAHERARQCTKLLLRKIKFAPIVSIQGPRQCGKSYLAKNILPKYIKSTDFKTLDENINRKLAEQNPHLFLTSTTASSFIIDEVQKVPTLFDEIKACVDEKRKPGQFIILGSTEFSIEAKIKESLTGRLSRVKMYPFNLSEVRKMELNPHQKFPFIGNKSRVPRAEVHRYLNNGGLPGIFIVKSELERKNLIKDWIDLTVNRDIFQFSDKKLDSEIAEQLLHQIAHLEEPTIAALSNGIGKSVHIIQKHLKTLKNLFVIDEIKPFPKSSGKAIYYLCDVALLDFFQASLAKKIQTWLLLEFRSQISYKGIFDDKINFFKSPRSQPVHFIHQAGQSLTSVKVISTESFDQRDLLIFETIKKKYPQLQHQFHLLYGGQQQFKMDNITISPWDFVV